MVSIVGCTVLGVLCVILAVISDKKVDSSISQMFFWLGVFALGVAALFVVTEDAGRSWMSGAIIVLLILSLSAQPKRRRGHL